MISVLPQKSLKQGKRNLYPKEVLILLRKKRAAFRNYRKSPSDSRKQRCEKLSSDLTRAIFSHHAKKEESVLANGSMKRFFQHVKSKLGSPEASISLKIGAKLLTDDFDIAEAFNDQFSSVFVQDDGKIPQTVLPQINSQLDDWLFSRLNVKKMLHSLRPDSAPGPDGIPSLLLKRLAQNLSVPLTSIFQQSFDTHTLPQEWLKAKIRPLFKKSGSRSDPSMYRPISLTSVCCKSFERLIKQVLLDHLHSNNIISQHQHGFLSKKSTETQLLECLNDWTSSVDRGKFVDVFYLDVAKAFDTVSHEKLLAKLESYKICGKLLKWIKAFLTGRTQYVAVNSSFSNEKLVSSGVPQGSVLGPLCFLLYINDLPSVVQNSSIKLFADDSKLYFCAKTVEDLIFLDDDIERVMKWFEVNQLGIALHKCNLLRLGAKTVSHDYVIGETTVKQAEKVKDLGIILSDNLNFTPHIDTIVAKASRMSGLIFKTFTCRDPDFLVRMFCVFVRSLLEYNTTVWSPSGLENIKKLERVQRSFTKRIPNLSETPYLERLQILKLDRLELRRIRFDIVMCFCIVKGLNGLKFDHFFSYAPARTARSQSRNSHLLYKKSVNKTCRQSFFAERVVDYWNCLGDDVINSKSAENFKLKLKKVNLDRFCKVSDF